MQSSFFADFPCVVAGKFLVYRLYERVRWGFFVFAACLHDVENDAEIC